MSAFAPKSLLQADRGQPAVDLQIVDERSFNGWRAGQSDTVRATLAAQRFTGSADSVAIASTDRTGWMAVAGVKSIEALRPWCLAKIAETLSEGTYRIANATAGPAAFGWLMAQYRFNRYKQDARESGPRVLLSDQPGTIDAIVRVAEAAALVRDLVNTPAADMGPAELEAACEAAATSFGATMTVTRGPALETGCPMIHAVGRAASRENEPRLIELVWGNADHPRIAVIGKGVCFDSGGLDIKPSSGMRLMKKDMGGAAHALALARLVMAGRLPVRLHLLIPAVENAISGNAFRPGDVLTSRKGLTVEITNTDAEGRLVLGDALSVAAEQAPGLIIDFATLTGAARVALGPDLPAAFANDDALAADMLAAGAAMDDAIWRLPLHAGYDEMLKSDIADLNNAPDGGFAGAITAALFLQKFVPEATPWLHLDIFAWRSAARPGRPKGGEALGLRAAWHLLEQRFR